MATCQGGFAQGGEFGILAVSLAALVHDAGLLFVGSTAATTLSSIASWFPKERRNFSFRGFCGNAHAG
jgi:hypothetical protein